MKKKILFKGCGTAICTPFDKDGVNLKEFEKLLENQIQNKADAIIVCGTTGEAATMTTEEKISTIKTAVDISHGRIPIIAGTGGNNTSNVIQYSKEVESLGVDGLLIVTPYYNKCTQNGLIEHYTEIAKNVSLPIIIYNVPGRTSVNIEPKTCLELSKIENIVAIKEASGNLSQVAEIAHLCGENLHIYSGNDDQIIPILSLGGKGVISVLSNVAPKQTHQMCEEYFKGNVEKAKDMQLEALDLIHALFCEVNPIPVKAAMNLMGKEVGSLRAPLTEMEDANKERLRKAMQEYGIL